MSDIHLIQYRLDDEHYTNAACPEHRGDILGALRQLGVGCLGTPAPDGVRCDGCETEKARA